jgi:hypothetical protein
MVKLTVSHIRFSAPHIWEGGADREGIWGCIPASPELPETHIRYILCARNLLIKYTFISSQIWPKLTYSTLGSKNFPGEKPLP